ncbi:hypothetical protein [Nonomuraea sp. WAC 01424]|uniref:hypothetical protein n=1 Tax=Nonomuraea sp. WAC 01424 TaxID=2203200 RepID=UPI000F79576C|nr:hypothetical protein [Nonomuraea sp. WAC 01424]
MEVESSICLSDLVPALRWSRPQQVAEVLGDPRLPAGWWSSLAVSRAFGTAGLDWVCERLARLISSRWDHLPLVDLLPALAVHQVDPALPGWPDATRTAVAGLGGWQRLRRLSPGDLGTPSATPEVVVGSVLREVLGRIPAQREAVPAQQSGSPDVTRAHERGAGDRQTGSFPAVSGPQTGSFPAVPGPQTGSFPAVPGPQTGSFPAVPAAEAGSYAAQPGSGPQRRPGAFTPHSDAFPAQPEGAPRAPGEGGLPQRPPAARPAAQQQPGPFTPPPDNAPQRPAAPEGAPQHQTGAFAAQPSDTTQQRQTGSFPAQPDAGQQRQTGSFPAQPEGGPRQTGSFPAQGGARLPQRPTAGRPDAGPQAAGDGPPYAAPVPAAGTPAPGQAPTEADHAMVRVVDGLFRGLDKLELAVAVHRLFAEDPVSLRTLAHKLLVDRDVLSQAQRTAEERVLHWLRSSESAPVTGHMFRLTEWLGAAATEEQLIGADPAHPAMVPSLRTPLWRVLVTLMPDRRLQDGWLVVGDIHGLQGRTRQLLAAAPPDADVVELLGELGIRAHSAKAWLDALPSESAPGPMDASPQPAQPLPRRTPGANGHHHRGGQPIPSANAGSIDPSAALATLSALSGGRSGMLPGALAGTPSTPPPPLPSPSSDPRRWQRIEVTPEHLRGGPVPVPEGYAAQLGMRPGTLLSVTGPGDNAIVLVWQGHQPVFDSLQPVLMRLNARPGDQVYVTVDGYRLEAQLTG